LSGHLVLLGDSIFDNAAYVSGGPSVIEHLRRLLPIGWHATLVAVDGATISSVERQIQRIPKDATDLVLSVGGNDALGHAGYILSHLASTIGGALEEIAHIRRRFSEEYGAMIQQLRSLALPLSVCTIYDSIPGLRPAEMAGLSVFNDVITRRAFCVGATLIDLRLICDERSDYAAISPIEPSASGGGKIARAIAAAIFDTKHGSRVIACP